MNATTLWIKVYAYDECLLIFDTSREEQSWSGKERGIKTRLAAWTPSQQH